MKKFFTEDLKKSYIIAVAVISLILLCIMDFYFLPKIQSTTKGMLAFDLRNLGYSHAQALKYLNFLGKRGTYLYLHFQIPIDCVFAVSYTFLFIALFSRIWEKGFYLIFIPILLFISDITENILSIIMLNSNGNISNSFTSISSAVTVTKTILTVVCSVLVIIFIMIHAALKAKKRRV